MEGNSLWIEVIEHKYGSEWGDGALKEGRGSYGINLWKFIRNGCNTFEKHIRFEVGDGTRIRFWFDAWSGESPLSIVFPVAFHMAGNQQVAVSDLLCCVNGTVTWNVTFTRNAQDWELDEMGSLL